MYKVETFIPKSALENVREALLSTDAGHIGNYKGCLSVYEVKGVWFSDEGSNPTIGNVGEWSEEPELKIEVNVNDDAIENTISALKKVHPYETPVINYWKIAMA